MLLIRRKVSSQLGFKIQLLLLFFSAYLCMRTSYFRTTVTHYSRRQKQQNNSDSCRKQKGAGISRTLFFKIIQKEIKVSVY